MLILNTGETVSMEGDDALLAETEVKVAPRRDEWMTTLPPERKVSPFYPLIVCLWETYYVRVVKLNEIKPASSGSHTNVTQRLSSM